MGIFAPAVTEAPHGGDFLSPRVQRITELDERSESSLTKFRNRSQQPRDQFAAAPGCRVFLQQQIAEFLFEPVHQFQHRMLFQISRQPGMLIHAQIVPVPAHERNQTAVVRSHRIQFAPAGEEVRSQNVVA
jgi:hypothetical protein